MLPIPIRKLMILLQTPGQEVLCPQMLWAMEVVLSNLEIALFFLVEIVTGNKLSIKKFISNAMSTKKRLEYF
jgi:hypothetical protein